MNIKEEKKKYPKYIIRCWTHSTIHCYLRKCRCKDCIYNNILESQECKGKVAVLILIELFGKPTEKQIKNYYEIEEELKYV